MVGSSLNAESLPVKKPNFLFIITDQQRNDDMSCEGNPWVKTPVLDSLAAGGTRFTKSFCANPLCVPSRASISSSLMDYEIAAIDPKYQLPTTIPSLGTVLRSAGYRNAWAGKWHVRPTYALPGSDQIPGFEILKTDAVPDDRYGKPEGEMGGATTDSGWTDTAVAFLHEKQKGPFFLTLSLINPHDVCGATEKKLADMKYPAELPELPKNFNSKSLVEFPNGGRHSASGVHEEWKEISFRRHLHNYYRFTEGIDQLIGRVLTALEETGHLQDTIVIFTSDHGEMGGSHHQIFKTKPYEEALRVPFIISGPGIPAGVRDTEHFVSGLDILPTVCDLAGIPAPKGIRGMSVRSILESQSAPWRTAVYAAVATGSEMRLVRTEKYKYILINRTEDPEVLFDLVRDPGETTNYALDASMSEVLQTHRKLLEDWMKETKDPFLNRKPLVPEKSGKPKSKKGEDNN